MSEQSLIDLKVLGYSFRLSASPDQHTELEKAAQLIDERYNEFRRKAPKMEPGKITIMVALDLMQEILQLNKQIENYENCRTLLNVILDEVEEDAQLYR